MMSAYGFLYRTALFPLYEGVLRSRPTLRYLNELRRTQWYTLDELHALQADKLKKLMSHARANVPYYQRLLQDAGLAPRNFQSPEDIAKLPLLTRDEARRSADERRSIGTPSPEIMKSTSGTSGTPLAFGYDKNSEYWRQAVRLRGYGWAGYRIGDRTLHYWGSLASQYQPTFKQRLKLGIDHLVRRDHYVDCAVASEPELERAVAEIRRLKPKAIVCYARAGATLSRYIVETGVRDWPDIPVICGAERVFAEDRPYYEAAFGSVFETYGSREVMLMAAECEAHDGMHVSMENLLVEVVVRENGQVRAARPGEIGEVAITDLNNYGMPFVRYLNGDMAVLANPGRCSCGRALTRIQSVEGRVMETLHDAAGRPVNGMFFSVMFSVLGDKVRNFQVVQRRDRSIDVRIVPTPKFEADLLSTIRGNCAKTFPGVEIRTDLVPDIPAQPNGKRQPIVIER
jgi:phenylacetate-CoA ligase